MIPLEYFQNSDTLALGRDLIGKYLMTCIDGTLTGGMITETESYLGTIDRACHAWGGRRTKRNEAMYSLGGIAYVYLCYGIHALFNIVTHQENEPHAILIRAIRPEIGIDAMIKRRNKKQLASTLASGPGSLTQSLGISTLHNAMPLAGPLIWLEDRGACPREILSTPRIGIDYAGEYASKPWRFIAQ
jgi:DNA-3-methyladenine glycosylase